MTKHSSSGVLLMLGCLPLQVLADFCAARGDWRSAAAAQLAFARRLQEEGLPSAALSKQISLALGAHRPCLHLHEPREFECNASAAQQTFCSS